MKILQLVNIPRKITKYQNISGIRYETIKCISLTASADGFTCPPGPHLNEHEQAIPHPSFPNLEDCTKFYVCLNGITPQEASCNNGQVFDEKKMLCGLPETVPEW